MKNSLKIKGVTTSAGSSKEASSSSSDATQTSGKVVSEFAGSDEPKMPELKWFAHDDNIKRLIEARCNDVNSVKSETFILEGSASATMSQKIASSIDGAMSKMGSKKSSTMEKQATKENSSKLYFTVEF